MDALSVTVKAAKSGGLVRGTSTDVAVTLRAEAVAAAAASPLALALALALDCSDSMRENLDLLRTASEYVIRNVPAGSYVSCTTFGTRLTTLPAACITDAASRDALVARVLALIVPSGATALGDALETAIREADVARTTLGTHNGFVLLLTDGCVNAGTRTADDDILAACVDGTIVTTVAFQHSEGGVNLNLLRQLAIKTGGAYHACSRADEVAATFGDFLGSATAVVAEVDTVTVTANGCTIHSDGALDGRLVLDGVPVTSLVSMTPAAAASDTLAIKVTVTLRAARDAWARTTHETTHTLAVVTAAAAGDDVADVTAHRLRRRVRADLARGGVHAVADLLPLLAAHSHAATKGTALHGIYTALRAVADCAAFDWEFSQLVTTQVQYVAEAERGAGQLLADFARPAAAAAAADASQAAFHRVGGECELAQREEWEDYENMLFGEQPIRDQPAPPPIAVEPTLPSIAAPAVEPTLPSIAAPAVEAPHSEPTLPPSAAPAAEAEAPTLPPPDEDAAYDRMKADFEVTHAKLMSPVRFFRQLPSGHDIDLLSRAKLITLYENMALPSGKSFIQRWLRDATMRTYERLEDVPVPAAKATTDATAPAHTDDEATHPVTGDKRGRVAAATEADDDEEKDDGRVVASTAKRACTAPPTE